MRVSCTLSTSPVHLRDHDRAASDTRGKKKGSNHSFSIMTVRVQIFVPHSFICPVFDLKVDIF